MAVYSKNCRKLSKTTESVRTFAYTLRTGCLGGGAYLDKDMMT